MPSPSHLSSDFARGFGVLLRRERAHFGAVTNYLLALAVLWLLLAVLAVGFLHDGRRLGGTLSWLWSWFAIDVLESDLGRLPVDTSGGPERWPPSLIRHDPWFLATKSAVLKGSALCLAVTMVVTGIGGIAGYKLLEKLGGSLKGSHHVRGPEIVADTVLARRVQKAAGASDLWIGQVPLVRGSETTHVGLFGTTGSGKTQAILRFLDAIDRRSDAAIVYDRAGTYVPYYFDADCGDVILNPLDRRCQAWSPWSEMAHPADADRLAASTIPHSAGHDKFFADAARTLYAALLTMLWHSDERSIATLLNLVLYTSFDDKARLLRGTEAAQYFKSGAERMALSVVANMITYVRSLRFLPATAGSDADFSIRRFMQFQLGRAPRSRRRPWLFLTSRATEHDSLRPLLSCLMDAAVSALLSLGENRDRRLWVVLDELASLQALPSLPMLLAEGRKYGAAAVITVQSVQQLFDTYGDKPARALLDGINTQAIFRLNDPESSRWAADVLGQRERDVPKESTRYDPGIEEATHVQITSMRSLSHIILPSEIQALPNLSCFVKLPGNWPVARTILPDPAATARTVRAAAFEPADPKRSAQAVLAAKQVGNGRDEDALDEEDTSPAVTRATGGAPSAGSVSIRRRSEENSADRRGE